MHTRLLLTAASILALAAGAPALARTPSHPSGANSPQNPKTAKILYNQNSSANGHFIESQNFTSGSNASDNNQAADDFVVPKGQTWTIAEVDASGVFYIDAGPATSENVFFYRDRNGLPGKLVANGKFGRLKGAETNGDFAIALPGKGLTLTAGTYWVSVVANMDFPSHGQWGWNVNGVQHGSQAVWQNPHGGFGVCPTWGTLADCGATGPDLMFDLRGQSKRK